MSDSKLDSSGTFSDVLKDMRANKDLTADMRAMIDSILEPKYKPLDETAGTSAGAECDVDRPVTADVGSGNRAGLGQPAR